MLQGQNPPHSDAAAPPLLRDGDQPFVLELRSRISALRLEFSDTASPENWRRLHPDMVIVCFDISSRPSLASLQRVVGSLLVSSLPVSLSPLSPFLGPS